VQELLWPGGQWAHGNSIVAHDLAILVVANVFSKSGRGSQFAERQHAGAILVHPPTDISYYTSPMAMGKRKRARQPAMWVPTTDLPTAARHPFYRRLNELLREHGFDDFSEAQCASFYADPMGLGSSAGLRRNGKPVAGRVPCFDGRLPRASSRLCLRCGSSVWS